ncbi:MAG: aminopeptidase [Chloroflexi bacterium]|nr:aminopeptidase [Chloroflexota bacterium]
MDRISPSGVPSMFANEVMRKMIQPRHGEQVLIVADTESEADWVHAMASAANAYGAEPTILIMQPTFTEGEDKRLSKVALKALEAADVYIPMAATTFCTIHDPKVAELHRGKKMRMFLPGGRYCAGLRGEALKYTLEALGHDYDKVAEWGDKFCKYLEGAREIRIASKAGTDVIASIEDIKFRNLPGLARKPGDVGGLPHGEVAGGPREGTTEGVIAIDGPIAYVAEKPALSQPVLLIVKRGRIVDIKGGEEAAALKRFVEANENANNIAEFSFGTDPFLPHTGKVNITDKRILGTMHTALGRNISQIKPFGTVDSPVHADAVLLKPSCWVDGNQLLDEGVPVV